MLIQIRELRQLSNELLEIRWSDGKCSRLTLGLLQQNCPCARCSGGSVGCEESPGASVIASVGNYALRVEFNQGCSRGVFSYALLRKLHLEE